MLPFINILVPTYGLMVILGLITCVRFLIFRNKKFNFSKIQLIGLTISSISGMVIGSKFVFMISNIPEIVHNHEPLHYLIEAFLFGGFVFYGGLLGAIGFVYLYTKIAKLDFRVVMNYIVPGFIVFHAFGRIGCFLAGCCYGIPVSWGIPMLQDPGVRRLPIQLIECLFEFGIVIWLLQYEDRLRKKEDLENYHLLKRYLLVYSVIRFILEFGRGDVLRGFFGIFSTSQWISLIIFVVIIVQNSIVHIKDNDKSNTEISELD